MTEKNYKDTPEWQKAFELAIAVSELTKKLAKAEGIHVRATAQHIYNRDAESVVFDIATAEGRKESPADYLRFLLIAQGTTFRLETRLLLDVKRDFVQQEDVSTALRLCNELGEMLSSKIEKLSAEARTLRLNRQIRPINFPPEE